MGLYFLVERGKEMRENLVLLRAEMERLSRQYREGSAKNAEMVKLERKINKIRNKILKIVDV